MSGTNPFTLTFGQKPTEFISRNEQIEKVIGSFNMETASNRVYMISGVRGSGKTVSLAEISEYYSNKEDWVVLRLSADTDIIEGAISELNRKAEIGVLGFEFSLNLGVAGFKVNASGSEISSESRLRNMLELLDKHHKKVLFVIDEILNNAYVRKFVGYFQIYISQNYPVYLVMAGIYDNISNLQNEKNLTFLYRAPKIMLEPLSLTAMITSYRMIFNLQPKEAADMARLTKGYPFAFQILGFLRWEMQAGLEELMPKFDESLTTYAYEKIWSELSDLDHKVLYVISTGVNKAQDIRERLKISPQLLNVYRKRLMDRGVVDGSVRGEMHLALPRFEVYIDTYCEVRV